MPRKIFVSCGQRTSEEVFLGSRLKELIDSVDGFEAYFADQVQNLESLSRNVFTGLAECVGAVIVLHERGEVTHDDGETWGVRSSVWINQEVAMLAFRQFNDTIDIPICAFKEPAVKLEGAMTSLITNPKEFTDSEQVLDAVNNWLKESNTLFPSIGSATLFEAKWQSLSDESRRVLTCIVDEGGVRVTRGVIRRHLQDRYGMDKIAANKQLAVAVNEIEQTNLAFYDIGQDGRTFTLVDQWRGQLRQRLRRWEVETQVTD